MPSAKLDLAGPGVTAIVCYLPLDSSSLLLLLESYILELKRTGDETNLTALLH